MSSGCLTLRSSPRKRRPRATTRSAEASGPWIPAFAGMNGDIRALSAVVVAFLADALDRHHLLVLVGIEHDHALRRAARYTDALDAGADELAAIGHQHDLVG